MAYPPMLLLRVWVVNFPLHRTGMVEKIGRTFSLTDLQKVRSPSWKLLKHTGISNNRQQFQKLSGERYFVVQDFASFTEDVPGPLGKEEINEGL